MRSPDRSLESGIFANPSGTERPTATAVSACIRASRAHMPETGRFDLARAMQSDAHVELLHDAALRTTAYLAYTPSAHASGGHSQNALTWTGGAAYLRPTRAPWSFLRTGAQTSDRGSNHEVRIDGVTFCEEDVQLVLAPGYDADLTCDLVEQHSLF